MIGLVLAGGSGTRLFPLSRKMAPKQFMAIFEGESLYQKTLKRMAGVCSKLFVITNGDQEFLARNQALEAGISAEFILEPEQKGTFSAIAYPTLKLGEGVFLSSPSDHYIRDELSWAASINKAREHIEIHGGIGVFGIEPSHPHTGYGYIVRDENQPLVVKEFVEKPDKKKAAELIDRGGLWNSGMFLYDGKTLASEITRLYGNLQIKDIERFYSSSPEGPFDKLIMERTSKAKVFSLSCGWSDVGNYESLYVALKKGEEKNSVFGEAITIDSHNNLIISENLAVALGVEGLAIINTRDITFIAKRELSEKVKDVVAILKGKKDERAEFPPTIHRPWGHYTVLEKGNNFKVKKIVVLPGKSISLQKHSKRAEHWVVVKGKAKVTIGDRVIELEEDQSAYVPIGVKHRISNPYEIPLEIIEVQTGNYLGEDDIVRYSNYFEGEGNG